MPFSVFIPCKYLSADFVISNAKFFHFSRKATTGVLSSRYGKSYIGDNSRYTFLGWFSTGDPSFDYSTGGATSEFVGIAIDQVDKVIHCNASKFEIPGRIECGSLSVNGREI